MARSGRRPGGSGTQEAILDAARKAFTASGYDGATIRGIAQAAAVDPALVHHYYGTKEQLFVAAMQLPIDPSALIPALLAQGVEGFGERLVRMFLSVWDSADTSPLVAMLRSAFSHEQSAAMLREFAGKAIIGRLVADLDIDRPELRANLMASQLFGLATVRYVIRLEPLASADGETVVAAVAPTLQRYLTGALDPDPPEVTADLESPGAGDRGTATS